MYVINWSQAPETENLPNNFRTALAGKEMEAIRAANFLTNNDPNGFQWIRTNKDPNAGSGAGGRAGRTGGRRRRA